MKKVLVVGSARKSGGGVASVIRLHEQMPVWKEFGCCWLETQIQAGVLTKLWYMLRASVKGFFMMPRFDIVHFHTVPDQSMTVQLPVLLWAKLWRKRVLFHIHCGNQLTMPMCTTNRIAHWCMGQADAIILLAESFKPMLDAYWPEAKGAKRFVLYNPLAGKDKIQPADHDTARCDTASPTKNKTILFAGIFNQNKAADVLVKAFAKAIGECEKSGKSEKSEPFRLVLLGSGPEEENLRKLIHDSDSSGKEDSPNPNSDKENNSPDAPNSWPNKTLRDRIVMPGYVWGEEKEAYFRNASIYVMCSHYEGFPMVVLEAWQHKVAVVTTPVGGLPDVLCAYDTLHHDNNSANALVFDYDDVEQLAAHLKRLMEDSALREQLGENGHQLVNERFSMERINADLREIWSLMKSS